MEEAGNTMSGDEQNLEELLGDTEWLHSLARTLVRDSCMADDLVQDTCVAVLSRYSGGPVPGVAWFRRVLRNFVYLRCREDANRRRRERAAAQPEAGTPTPAKLLERAELQEVLIHLVLELPEPYRSTVLLRFFEGRTPGQIATEHQVPITTVRSRLAGALGRLRRKLEIRYGGKESRAWITALAPLLVTGPPGEAAGTGATMNPDPVGSFQFSDVNVSHCTSLAMGGTVMTAKTAIVVTVSSLALLALGWGLGRSALNTSGRGGVDSAAEERFLRLENGYGEATRRIETLEAAWKNRKRLDETLAALTEEIDKLGKGSSSEADGAKPQDLTGPDVRGLWTQLLELGLDDSGLWSLLHLRGNIEGLASLVDEVETWGEEKLSNPDLPEDERARCESMLHLNRFRKGYIRFALGDLREAEDAFREQIAAVDELEETLTSRGEELESVTAIYRGRSRYLLDVLETVGGRPAPVDFQLADTWVTDRRASLSDLAGKTVAVFFRGSGDTRSAGLLGSLSKYIASQPDMETVTLCWHRGDLGARMQKLESELAEIEYTGIAGFDPDGADWSLFRAYKAGVGSASLYILNPRGEVVWVMQDPRTQDFAFAKRLLLRAAGR